MATPTYPTLSDVTTDGKYNAFPWVTKNSSGTLVAVCREGASHISTDGKLAIIKSTDVGATWGSKSYAASPAGGHDYRDPSIVCTATGRLIVNFFDYDGTNAVALYTVHSDDGGATWSSLSSALTPYTSVHIKGACSGAILQHSTGPLIWPVYGQNTGDTDDRMGVLISADDGNTWGTLIDITTASAGYDEASLIELPDHSLLGFITNEITAVISKVSSTDVGLTWTAPSALPLSVTTGRPAAIICPGSNTIILWYRNHAAQKAVWVYSNDLGATWSAEQLYTNNPYMYAGGIGIGSGLIAVVIAYQLSASQADLSFATQYAPTVDPAYDLTDAMMFGGFAFGWPTGPAGGSAPPGSAVPAYQDPAELMLVLN